MSKTEPRIILLDIESMPNLREVMKVLPQLSAYPGLTLKASINSIICFGWQVFGEKQINCINAWDFPNWKQSINDDKKLLEAITTTLEDCDAVVTHNGKRFDWRFIQTRLLINGLPPLPKILHIDTCQLAKSNLMFFNNRLNTIAKFVSDEEKLENGGWELWEKVMQRHKPSMDLMTKYCKQDVNVLNRVFKILRPFASNIPNYNLFAKGDRPLCVNCGGTRLEKKGFLYTKTNMSQRFRCIDCGSQCSIKSEGKFPR